uniref:hypothetical protein n=1 Tax=Vibrio neptunius TaxID=170651 RepID=UPI00196A1AB6
VRAKGTRLSAKVRSEFKVIWNISNQNGRESPLGLTHCNGGSVGHDLRAIIVPMLFPTHLIN